MKAADDKEAKKPAKPDDQATQRRIHARVYAVLSAALLVGLAFQLNYISFRHYERWDWTQDSLYTLSERTKVVLHDLDVDVEVWILLSEQEAEFAELRNLIARYEAETGKIQARYVDPDRDPGRYREIAQRFDLGAMLLGDIEGSDVAAVIAAGDRHWEITRDDLISRSFDPLDEGQGVRIDVEGERAITGALVELTTGRPTKVCLTHGHGEFEVEGSSHSLSGFAAEMRRENLQLEEIETRGQRRIPEGCDAVAVIGPEIAFAEAESDLLRRYVRDGGNLFVALDPIPNADQTALVPLGLETMLRDLGVRVDRSVVIEPNPALHPAGVGNPLGPYAVVGWGDHPITASFRGLGLPLVVSEARSVRPIDDEGGATVLFSTSEQSHAETDLPTLNDPGGALEVDAEDIPGPVSLAVATRVEVTGHPPAEPEGEGEGEHEAPGGRLVVVGDATMFASEYLGEPTVVNRELASAIMGWLTEREALIAIAPRTIQHQPVSMSDDDVGNLFLRVVVLIPLAFIFLGFAVWWNRRQ